MTTVIYIIVAVLFVCWLGIVFVGAPYVPTKQRDVLALLDLLKLTKTDHLVDLGSGDGRLLLAAARQGVKSTGYELNPFLVLIARWRLRKYQSYASVRTADFWLVHLPADTTLIFTFLAGPFMKRLDGYLQRETRRLDHDILLVSYGFSLPSRVPEKHVDPFVIYRFSPK